MQKELIEIWKRRAQAQMDYILRQGRKRESLKLQATTLQLLLVIHSYSLQFEKKRPCKLLFAII